MNGIPAPVGRRICLPTGARTYCAGQRVTRVEDEVITHFYYTGSALLFTTVNEYVLQTQNILDPSGTIVASKRFEGQAETEQDPYADDYFFYRYDIRGSVTNIVDGAGAVVKSYDYDEFGVTTSTGDTFFNEVTFTGSVADASGLLYMNARYYNPSTARFLSQDTYTGSASDPWTQHLYVYCNNNPVNLVDPTGHAPVGPMRKNMVYINDGGSALLQNEEDDGIVIPEEIKDLYFAFGSKNRSFREFTDMRSYTDEEIQRMARDKSLPPELRQKAKTTEKLRGLRNKQKRTSRIDMVFPTWQPVVQDARIVDVASELTEKAPNFSPNVWIGIALMIGSAAALIWLIGNDVTMIGVMDDGAIPVAATTFLEGLRLCFG